MDGWPGGRADGWSSSSQSGVVLIGELPAGSRSEPTSRTRIQRYLRTRGISTDVATDGDRRTNEYSRFMTRWGRLARKADQPERYLRIERDETYLAQVLLVTR